VIFCYLETTEQGEINHGCRNSCDHSVYEKRLAAGSPRGSNARKELARHGRTGWPLGRPPLKVIWQVVCFDQSRGTSGSARKVVTKLNTMSTWTCSILWTRCVPRSRAASVINQGRPKGPNMDRIDRVDRNEDSRDEKRLAGPGLLQLRVPELRTTLHDLKRLYSWVSWEVYIVWLFGSLSHFFIVFSATRWFRELTQKWSGISF